MRAHHRARAALQQRLLVHLGSTALRPRSESWPISTRRQQLLDRDLRDAAAAAAGIAEADAFDALDGAHLDQAVVARAHRARGEGGDRSSGTRATQTETDSIFGMASSFELRWRRPAYTENRSAIETLEPVLLDLVRRQGHGRIEQLHRLMIRTAREICLAQRSFTCIDGWGAAGRPTLESQPFKPFQSIGAHYMSRFRIAIGTGVLIALGGLGGCATESSRAVAVAKVESAATPYRGTRVAMSVGKFDNRSSFMRGMFTDGVDRLGSQAKTTLISHLQQSQRFNVLDRENLVETKQEAQFQAKGQSIKGADYVLTGDISEFGRKEVGDRQLFGLLGRGKSQVAYAKVTLNIVNSLTSEIVFSVRGAGEYELSNREVIGFGGTAGYDSTLNGKVLDLAMREAVNNLVAGLDDGQWSAPGAGARQ